MLGAARHAKTMVPRITEADSPLSDLFEDLDAHNQRMRKRVHPSDDAELDEASWAKTCEDVAMQALDGPYDDLSDLHPCARLVPPHP